LIAAYCILNVSAAVFCEIVESVLVMAGFTCGSFATDAGLLDSAETPFGEII